MQGEGIGMSKSSGSVIIIALGIEAGILICIAYRLNEICEYLKIICKSLGG
jgi:hypothetical protein